MRRAAIIGQGNLGRPIARNLLRGGYAVALEPASDVELPAEET